MFFCCASPDTESSQVVVAQSEVAAEDDVSASFVQQESSKAVAEEGDLRRQAAEAKEAQLAEEVAKRAAEDAKLAEEGAKRAEEDAKLAEAKRAENDKAEQQRKEAEAEEARRREAEAQKEKASAEEGLAVTVRQPGGTVSTVFFVTKPLGMEFISKVKPVKIKKAVGHARVLDIKQDSELVSIAGVGVEDLDFAKILEMLKEQMAPLPTGIMLGFTDPTGGKKSIVFQTRPLGMEFSKTVPMTVVKSGGAAQAQGVQPGWVLISMAGRSVEGMLFDETLSLLKGLITTLPEQAKQT